MKNLNLGTLGSEYYKKAISSNKKRIESLDELQSEKMSRLSGCYEGIISGLIRDLEILENNLKIN
jgi:hypothetical protein